MLQNRKANWKKTDCLPSGGDRKNRKHKMNGAKRRGKFRAQKKGKLLSSHRSTIYPCFVPNLGDLTGAGRERLTRGKSR